MKTEKELSESIACGDCDPCLGGRPDQCAVPVFTEKPKPMKTENDELGELDAWIAEHVMGWTPNKSQSLKYRKAWNVPGQELLWTGEARLPELYECDHPEDEMFRPTTNDADAMAVLRKCADKTGEKSENSGIMIFALSNGWYLECGNIRAQAAILSETICRFARSLYSASEKGEGGK